MFLSTWSCVVAYGNLLIKSFQVVICFSCSGWILQSEECLRKTVESMRYMAADSKEPLYMVLTGNSVPLSTIYTVAYCKCRRAVEETDHVESAQLFSEVHLHFTKSCQGKSTFRISLFVGSHIKTSEGKKLKQGMVMTKVKYSLATWLKCKLAMSAIVERRSPLEECFYFICVHKTNLPSISQASKCWDI